MVDVDSLTWSFGHLISYCIAITALVSPRDRAKRPCAYTATKFIKLGNVNITETEKPSSDNPPFLTSNVLHLLTQYSTTHSPSVG